VKTWGAPTSEQPAGDGKVYEWLLGASEGRGFANGHVEVAHYKEKYCKRWVVTDAAGIINTAEEEGDCP
jgi:hypothetical protein